MWPIVTDGVGLSVTIKTAEQIDMQFGMWTRVSSRNRLDGVQICTREGAILWREGSGRPARHIQTWAVDILEVTQQGAAPVWCGCRLECTRCAAHWRNLASTTEPSCAVAMRPYLKLLCLNVFPSTAIQNKLFQ